jgi:hypothetical protein
MDKSPNVVRIECLCLATLCEGTIIHEWKLNQKNELPKCPECGEDTFTNFQEQRYLFQTMMFKDSGSMRSAHEFFTGVDEEEEE